MEFGEAVREFEEFFSQKWYEKVAEAVQEGEDSVVVDFHELDVFNPELADYLREDPDSALDAASEGAMGVDIISDEDFNIRFTSMPEEDFIKIKNLRSKHIGKFVPIEGMIKRASQVKPELTEAEFECTQCGDLHLKEQDSTELKSPYKCECGSRKFEVVEKKMTDTQNVVLEENPESREGSEQPATLNVRLEGDLVDPDFQKKVVPGNVANITGVVREKPFQKNSKKYDIYMEANYLDPTEQEFEELELEDEEVEKIEELAENDDIFEKIASSIAPSIFGHDKIKEAVALQLFGGVKKTREDGVMSRGDIHILLIGEPGTGKCVAPDTEILDSGGGKEEIGELVEERLADAEEIREVDDGYYVEVETGTWGFDRQSQLEQKTASKMWKREAPEKMYRIKTSSGRELEVTPSHPLFIQKHGAVAAEKASELEEGSFIAAPRKLEAGGNDELDIKYRKSKANNAVRLQPPEKITPGFSRLVGYLAAEGHLQSTEDRCDTVYITNNDEEILEDVENQLEELGLNFSRRKPHRGKDAREIICSSSELTSFLESFEPSLMEESSEREFPGRIMRASKENIEGFIKAFVDAEGTVSKKERELVVGSTSKDLLEDLKTALLRFGINSQLKPREESYRLRISGKDFQKYISEIGLVTERKTSASRRFDSGFNTNTDVVPNTGELLRTTREKLGMTQFDFTIDRGSYQHYERLDRNPSRGNLQDIVESFRQRKGKMEEMAEALENPDWETVKHVRKKLGISQQQIAANTSGSQTLIGGYERGELKGENKELLGEAAQLLQSEIRERVKKADPGIQRLQLLSSSDIFWDEIVEIESIEPDYNWVYDLEIPEQHNYITNGIVSHNSQILKFTGELAPKGRYVVGKSSTGAGLTAAAVRNEQTGEFELEAGAIVLANKGLAAVDEIDKMSSEDRSSMHEAMEQQQISVAKANIQATLNAQTSILAAGNPKLGRFDPYEPIPQQIDLGDTLLSRFDFIFPVKDEPDREKDEELSRQVLQNHIEPEDLDAEIDAETLRKYVAYAKKNLRPQLTQEAANSIQDFYVSMRESGSEEGDSVPITARQLEALVRVAEASARAELRDEVVEEDAQRAIDILTYCLKQIGVDPETGDYDIDMIESGVSSSQRNRLQTIKQIIRAEGGADSAVQVDEVVEAAEEQGLDRDKAEEIINRLKREGDLWEPQPGHIQQV